MEKAAIIEALLLHDMGNVIKFDFRFSHLLGDEEANIKFWKEIQLKFKQKYGNEHTATLEIAKEIGVSPQTFGLLEWTGSSKLEQVTDTMDWSAKITCYCDFRVSPFGIVTVNERFDELVNRYHGRTHDLGDIAKTEQRRLFCLQLQEQLQKMVNFDLNLITDQEIEKYFKMVENLVFIKR